jgi:hypothetical protein
MEIHIILKNKRTNYVELLERPSVVRTLGSFPAFYGTRRFNTEFTSSPAVPNLSQIFNNKLQKLQRM